MIYIDNNFYIKQIKLSNIKFSLKIKQVNGYLLIDYLIQLKFKKDYEDMWHYIRKQLLDNRF